MGKSTCAGLLRSRSIPVVDTDDLARQIVEPGQPALEEIRESFGNHVVGVNGELNRRALAEIVFAKPEARKALEAILHPRIRHLWRSQMTRWSGEGHRLAFVVIPLLFETHAEKELNLTLCVACSSATQHQRLLARGWSTDQINQRIQAQLPVEEKMNKADFVLWSEGAVEIHSMQLDQILRSLEAEN